MESNEIFCQYVKKPKCKMIAIFGENICSPEQEEVRSVTARKFDNRCTLFLPVVRPLIVTAACTHISHMGEEIFTSTINDQLKPFGRRVSSWGGRKETRKKSASSK